MRNLVCSMAVLALAALPSAAQVFGNYQGGFKGDWVDKDLKVQVVGEGWNQYRAEFTVGERQTPVEVFGSTYGQRALFTGVVNLGKDMGGVYTVTAVVQEGVMTGEFKGAESRSSFYLSRTRLVPPTLGQEPPENAIVLMEKNIPSQQAFVDKWHAQYRWDVKGDGSVRISNSSVVSKEVMGSGHYHVEFKLAYMPNERGQGRSNSGVYLQGRYEVQVLDSFADEPADNHCGGIYQKAVPITNACLPPLQWQTYDIDFTAPQFDNGQKVANARITVKHNGVVIHDDVELDGVTGGSISDQEAAFGPLMLQDHNDSVSYRNVWFVPSEG